MQAARADRPPRDAEDPRWAEGDPRRLRRLSATEIAVRYIAFAALAMLCNLMVQRLVLASLRQGEEVAFGWAPLLLDWVLHDMLGVIAAGAGWRKELGAPVGLSLAIAAGTAVGLAVKYLLDKRWIFQDLSTGARAHARRFSLYAAIGLVTTAIFWGAEALAWAIWGTPAAREIGAVLGLSLGYLAKYRFDRRFVFTPSVAARRAR